ncbi:MAG: UDP-N-acetylmuramoyl-L-alanyl-D-glutamate--2,6-diaminopimelate ligase [Sphingobacteriales bacterium]|jgi:UDP-N-acetylmuramoyl-L-alanyl-D-glutamate--2,6-diaminopimelate ligase
MMNLRDILYKVQIKAVHGSTDLLISGIVSDSRQVTENSCFVAISGTTIDGHDHIYSAISAGAQVIVCEKLPAEVDPKISYIEVANTAIALGIMAHNFNGNPSGKMLVVGITGTNGKTTVATLLYQLFTGLGYSCGLISTVKYIIDGKEYPSTHTTPDALRLSSLLREMREQGCSHVFMESSSHAIHQYRMEGIEFAGGIFTNITHDHLDYHKTFDEYIKVKKSFFDHLPKTAFAISNMDDKRGAVMLQNTVAEKYYYSLLSVADFKGKLLDNNLNGLHMLINEQEVNFRLIGEFNAYNLLAVYAAAICLGEDRQEVLTILSNLPGAEGRFEYQLSKDGVIGIVDYAHTPDALLNVLQTIKKLRKGYEKVITVVGCGGDRDKTKRPLMGGVACEHSDKVIFTSDNPRSEDPIQIIKDMESDLKIEHRRKFLSIADRKEAIKTAVSLANTDDIILIAGKGHEKYQEVAGVRLPFDDKQVLNESFELR